MATLRGGGCYLATLAAVAALYLLAVAGTCDAVVFKGTLNTGDSFSLLGRFALNTGGDNRVIFRVEKLTNYENLMYAIYYAGWDEWQSISDDETCVAKLGVADTLLCTNKDAFTCPTVPNIVRRPVWAPDLLLNGTVTSGEAVFIFDVSQQVTWVWVALANCNARACDGTSLAPSTD